MLYLTVNHSEMPPETLTLESEKWHTIETLCWGMAEPGFGKSVLGPKSSIYYI